MLSEHDHEGQDFLLVPRIYDVFFSGIPFSFRNFVLK